MMRGSYFPKEHLGQMASWERGFGGAHMWIEENRGRRVKPRPDQQFLRRKPTRVGGVLSLLPSDVGRGRRLQ